MPDAFEMVAVLPLSVVYVEKAVQELLDVNIPFTVCVVPCWKVLVAPTPNVRLLKLLLPLSVALPPKLTLLNVAPFNVPAATKLISCALVTPIILPAFS